MEYKLKLKFKPFHDTPVSITSIWIHPNYSLKYHKLILDIKIPYNARSDTIWQNNKMTATLAMVTNKKALSRTTNHSNYDVCVRSM